MFCYGFVLANLSIFFRVASLALGQSYDCPSASEATLKNMDIYITLILHEQKTKAKHNN